MPRKHSSLELSFSAPEDMNANNNNNNNINNNNNNNINININTDEETDDGEKSNSLTSISSSLGHGDSFPPRTPKRATKRVSVNVNVSLNTNEEDSPLLLKNKKRDIRYDHDSARAPHNIGDPLQFPKYRHTLTLNDLEKMASIESLDYVHIDNEMYRAFEKERHPGSRVMDEFLRWLLVGIIGLTTGFISYAVHIAVATIDQHKFEMVFKYIPVNKAHALAIFLMFNCGLVLLSALCVVFEPSAAGSGLPEVKGYLNGVRIPRAFNFRNCCATFVSVICCVASSLPVGPEGPMIHLGGMVGGGLGEMRSRTLGVSLPFFPRFQNSRDRRDFISCGAAAGVAAAFGAPIGGVLFALEEASSFWSQKLTWRTFFGTMIAVLTMNIGLSNFSGVLNMHSDILFDITSTIVSYDFGAVLIPSAILGLFGGISGGVFTYLNLKLNKFRRKHINTFRWLRVVEVLLITIAYSTILLYLPSLFGCKEMAANPVDSSEDPEAYATNAYTCPPGFFNDMATLILTPQERAVSHLIGVPEKRFSAVSLVVFCAIYFSFSLLVAGTGISSGLFVPMMIIGASYGRAFGHLMSPWKAADIDIGIYGLIGAASFMCGVTRMTVSLAVILIELTNDIQFLLPIIVTIMISKVVGDYITFPLYDAQLHQKSIPFLESEPLDEMSTMTCEEAMAKDVVCFESVEKVSVLLHALNLTRHNGFPVVEPGPHGDLKFKGIILRRQILVLLKYCLFGANQLTLSRVTHSNFRDLLNGPRLNLSDIKITQMDLNAEVELWYYMNRSAVVVHPEMNLAMAFRLFRTMGLRHLPVVNDDNNVVGMITRKDLLHEVCEQKYHEKHEEEKYEKEREREALERRVLQNSQDGLARLVNPVV